MRGMAEHLHADLDLAEASGLISSHVKAQMSDRCKQCAERGSCLIWLIEPPGLQAKTPSYCVNAQELQFIRAVQNGSRPA